MITTGLPKIMGNMGIPFHRFHFGIDGLSDRDWKYPPHVCSCCNEAIRTFRAEFHWGQVPLAMIKSLPFFKESQNDSD